MLSTPDGPERGYLTPTSDDRVHAFRFTANPPTGHGGPLIKYKHFFATTAGCGGMCGGPQLVYDETPEDDAFSGMWLVAPREGEGDDGTEEGYLLRWYEEGEGPVPEGYTRVYLMREQAE